MLQLILINIYKANIGKESGSYSQVDVDALLSQLKNLISTGFLSSPFSYRLLYKNHKRPDSCSYDPLHPPKIRRKRDQHRRAGSHNLNSISPRFFLLLHVFVRGKTGPTSRRGPVRFPMSPARGPASLKTRDLGGPRSVLFGTCHRRHGDRDFGPRRPARERTCRASDTAVTNDIVEPAYSRRLTISSSRASSRRPGKYCRAQRRRGSRRARNNTWPVDCRPVGVRIVARSFISTYRPAGQYFRRDLRVT